MTYRVCEFDVDADVVAVELEDVALVVAVLFLNVHLETGDGAVDVVAAVVDVDVAAVVVDVVFVVVAVGGVVLLRVRCAK